MAGRRQGRSLAEAGVHEDIVKSIDAAGDHHVRFACGQFHRRQVEGT